MTNQNDDFLINVQIHHLNLRYVNIMKSLNYDCQIKTQFTGTYQL